MKNEQPSEPAGYDFQGRPLYYHEPQENPESPKSLVSSKPQAYEGHNFDPRMRAQYSAEPDLVHASRAIEPQVPEISDELLRRHEESAKGYPFLNLSEGEYVILRIKRHPIGLLIPVITTALIVIILAVLALLMPDIFNTTRSAGTVEFVSPVIVSSTLLLLAVISGLIGYIAVWVYQKNQFFLTNESVIQEIQHSLFAHHEQTVSLGSIEDASFKRSGILQHLFDYGTMRLSTEGEETTYRFAYVENPKQQVATVNNAVEAFKNGRPVEG